MFDLLALLLGERYWRIHSRLIAWVLRRKGVRVGRFFHIRGIPKLKLRGRADHVVIEDHVTILGDVDIRNRENGRLVIEAGVTIENDCRFVAAREGTIRIGSGTVIGAQAVFNGGGSILIGSKCLFAVRTTINANEHRCGRQRPIREQGFIHKDVIIEDDCWIGANVAITKGSVLRRGSVVGANAVVTRPTRPYSINAGIPAVEIAQRR